MLHLSLDGATAETHDAFRGFRGSFDRTLEILRGALDLGVPVQIGTTVCRVNAGELAALAAQIRNSGATVWNVFFLVPTGRGRLSDMLSAEGARAGVATAGRAR